MPGSKQARPLDWVAVSERSVRTLFRPSRLQHTRREILQVHDTSALASALQSSHVLLASVTFKFVRGVWKRSAKRTDTTLGRRERFSLEWLAAANLAFSLSAVFCVSRKRFLYRFPLFPPLLWMRIEHQLSYRISRSCCNNGWHI